MSIYVKQFDATIDAKFTGLASITNSNNTVIVGGVGTAALALAIDQSGNVVDQIQYTLGESTITFIKALPVSDRLNPGDYLLFGSKKVTNNNNLTLVVRIKPDGSVVWANTYGNTKTRQPLSIVNSIATINEERFSSFIFIAKNVTSGTNEDIEVVRIDRFGSVLVAKMMGTKSSSDQAAGLLEYENGGAVIYGGSNAISNFESFIIIVDSTLSVLIKKLLGTVRVQEILALVQVDTKGQYVAAGSTGSAANRDTFMFTFNINSNAAVTAKTFDLLQGSDTGIRKLLKIGEAYYLFGYRQNGSLAAKFNSDLSLAWTKKLNISGQHFLSDALYDEATSEIKLCGWAEKGGQQFPLSVRTDLNFTTCITLVNPNPVAATIVFTVTAWTNLTVADYAYTVNALKLTLTHNAIPNAFLCPAPIVEKISLEGLVQSPYLYMQAAGSDQADDSSKGIQLRWRFNKSLGENHMAKGPYANVGSPYYTTIGFNKPDDYVKIYRVPYTKQYQAKIKFKNNQLPSQEINTGTTREWRYNNIVLTSGGTGTTNVIVRFNDVAQYNTIRATMTTLKPEDLVKQYTGIMEVETQNKLFFSAEFTILYNSGSKPSAYLRTEAISYDDPSDLTTAFTACRKKFLGQTALNNAKITCESIKFIRLDYSIAYVSEIALETYYDFINSTNNQNANNTWEQIGKYALTIDTSLAYDRLENKNNPYIPNAKKYAVDKQWNKYNDANATTGEFKVRVDNYKHRWSPVPNSEHPTTIAADGIQNAIVQYLDYSKTDVKANVAVPVEDDPGNNASINISYFDILRLVGIDYHIARMMGLGCIDSDVANNTIQYIHLMAYTSRGPLETGDPTTLVKDHLYMTLPTTRKDYRLPQAPVQIPVSYGMSVSNGIGETNQLTDAQGYVAFDDVRFVNVNRNPYNYEKPFGSFFADPTEFCLCDETVPVMYGLDYKGSAETVFRKPEITQDEEYFDYAGYNEVIEIPEQGQNPLYVHQEREEGIHCYVIYSINWFSRISPISNQQCTDYTLFNKVKNLLPPSNFAVQLIQKEEPLMLTTPSEQATLAAISPTVDNTLLRAVFEWNHNHNVNYQFAERAQLFYRENTPDSVQGEILSVTQLAGNKVLVKVKDFIILSTTPTQTISPTIPSGEESKYIGSIFSTATQAFTITAINNSAFPYPEFTLNQIKQTSSSDPLNTNQFTTLVNWLKPIVGDKFLVVENLAVENNWSTHLNRTVYLEKFHSIFKLKIENTGTSNNGTYKIEHVNLSGSNTDIVFLDKLKSNVVAGNIRYERTFKLVSLNASTNKLVIAGNVTAEFTGVTTLRVFGSGYNNDKDYAISGTPVFVSSNTEITVIGPIADSVSTFGYIAIEKTANITAVNILSKTITVAGNLTAQIIPPYIETKTNYDSTETKFSYGGIYQQATVTDLPDTYTGSLFGAYTVKFNSYTLPPHVDPNVEWIKGVLRISDTNTSLVNGVPQFTMKSLQVWEIKKDISGIPLSPLELVVFDPTFAGPYPIQTGTNINVNYHPSYRIYLLSEFNGAGNNDNNHQFNKATMLPGIGDGTKVTYMGIRSLDRVKEAPTNAIVQYESYIAPLVPVLAQEIVAPAAPKDLSGPLFATRPDFFKKSSYTVDVKLDTTAGRQPYGVLVYRGNETKVLDTLYSDATQSAILPIIAQLKISDTAAYYTLLHDLVNVVTNAGGDFDPTPNSLTFSFPLPDNHDYIIPNRDKNIIVKPFLSPVPMIGTQKDIVRNAILESFLSLTEQPVIYKYVKGGITTSGRKPIFRNYNGDIITPILPETIGYNPDDFDPSPMAVKFAKDITNPANPVVLLPGTSGYNNSSNDFYVRFTDYSLDGASLEYYFYFACEITNQLVIGPPSPIKAPVLMVNSTPAESPGIREVLTILADPVNNVQTSVQFKINIYNETEGIKQLWIYRAYSSAEASNIRSMKLARKIDIGQPIIDDFSDLNIPPYGETLFYKIVAVRRIKNELLVDEDILSLPSNAALTNVVDIFNPLPPKIYSENGNATPTELQNVILKWKATAYNGTYRLQKLNSSGNWVEFYSVKVKDTDMQYPPLDISNNPDFTNFMDTVSLPRVDADGNSIYHRYRVQVENSSGLFNLTEFELTLAKGASDLQEIDSPLSYSDSNGHNLAILHSVDFITGASQPGIMTFTYPAHTLPAGHNTFIKNEITVTDDLNHSITKTINAPGGSVPFNDGDGGLVLNGANRNYTIKTKIFTDFAPNGAVQTYTLNFLAGPAYDLKQITSLVKLTDSTHDIDPLISGNVNDGVGYPIQLKFTKIVDLTSIGQMFDHMDITVTDDLGNIASPQTIGTSGTYVTFTSADGIVVGTSNPNRSYEIKVKIFTDLVPLGNEAIYNISYTYTPCDDLIALTSIAKYQDNNSTVINPATNQTVTSVTHPNGSITIGVFSGITLPIGHTFVKMDVILEDDLGGASIKPINTITTPVTFNDGDGNLVLNSSNPHRTYFVTCVLYTNLCSNGRSFAYTIKY